MAFEDKNIFPACTHRVVISIFAKYLVISETFMLVQILLCQYFFLYLSNSYHKQFYQTANLVPLIK